MENEPLWPCWEEMGDGEVPPFLARLCHMLPEQLYVLYDPVRDRYCYRAVAGTENCGLIAFSQAHLAHAYIAKRRTGWRYTEVWQVSLDGAFTLAQERHAFVNSVFLCDNPSKLEVHHVR